jgi:hypothetical protein
MKICNKCNIDKNETEYDKDPRNKSGLQGICKQCKRKSADLRAIELAKGIGLVPISEKQCNRCNETKSVNMFFKDKFTSDGYYSICKSCKDEAVRKWRLENPEKVKSTTRTYANKPENYKRMRLQRYDILPSDFDKMMTDQNGKCKLCFKTPETTKRPLCVDHDHVTGEVRGLLCYGCNRLMVLIDNEELLKRALAYARKIKK